MSSGLRHPLSFFEPLTGKTSTFLMGSRQDNLAFARAVMELLSASGRTCTFMDLDALYSSHADVVFPTTSVGDDSWTLRVPCPGSDIDVEMSQLFEVPHHTIVLDSLNTLYHLFSLDDGSSRGRRMGFALASLSYLARTNSKAVILCMYRREGFGRLGTARSISGLSDITASVEVRESELTVRAERGSAWPGGVFSTRIP
jgi:hypothetical protein